MPKILAIHGPNLNLLGDRETEHYGKDSAEAAFVERIHAAKSDETAYIIINPAGLGLGPMGYELALEAAMRSLRVGT